MERCLATSPSPVLLLVVSFQIIINSAKKDSARMSKLFSDFFWTSVVPSHLFFLLTFFCPLFSFLLLSSDLLFSEIAYSSITFISNSRKFRIGFTFIIKVTNVSLLY